MPPKKLLTEADLQSLHKRTSILWDGLRLFCNTLLFFDGYFIEKDSIKDFQKYFDFYFYEKLYTLEEKGKSTLSPSEKQSLYKELVSLYEEYLYWDIVVERLNAGISRDLLVGEKKVSCSLWAIDLLDINSELSDAKIAQKLQLHKTLTKNKEEVILSMNQSSIYNELKFLAKQKFPTKVIS